MWNGPSHTAPMSTTDLTPRHKNRSKRIQVARTRLRWDVFCKVYTSTLGAYKTERCSKTHLLPRNFLPTERQHPLKQPRKHDLAPGVKALKAGRSNIGFSIGLRHFCVSGLASVSDLWIQAQIQGLVSGYRTCV